MTMFDYLRAMPRRIIFLRGVGPWPARVALFLIGVVLPLQGAYPLPSKEPRLPAWRITQGSLTENGQPAFPLGIYYVSHFPRDKRRRLDDLKTIAAAGFTVLHTPIDDKDDALLNVCARLGIGVIGEFNADPGVLMEKYQNYPALRAWSTFDDVDARRKGVDAPRYAPGAVSARTSEIHHSTPRILTYISGGFPRRLGKYAAGADLVGLQTYPIPDEEMSAVGNSWKAFQAGRPDTGTVPVANLQLFGWKGKKRAPEGFEVRNMTFQALIGGAKGLLYYTFYDEYTDLRRNQRLWNDLRKLVSELEPLQDFLLNGKRCVFTAADPDTFSAVWELPAQNLFMAVNAGARTASVDIRGCDLQGLDAIPARPVSLAADAAGPNGRFLLEPMEVLVEVIKKK